MAWSYSLQHRRRRANAQQITSDSLKDFASFMREQNAFWAKIIKDVGIKTQ